jgi:hypothetical protein
MRTRRALLTSCFALSLIHCNSQPEPSAPSSTTTRETSAPDATGSVVATSVDKTPAPIVTELDPVSQPPAGVSLLLLDGRSDRNHLVDVVEHRLGGTVYQMQGSRLVVAAVPANADAVLTGLGMVTRFARSLATTEIPSATIEEQRFVQVFDSRFYPADATTKAIRMMRTVRPRGQAFERAPSGSPVRQARAIKPADATAGTVDYGTVPFATGTMVVAVILPESNGNIDPSTEDWTADAILSTYAKIENSLEAYTRSEPNAHLRFILHYESSPAPNGLVGTVDWDYEAARELALDSGNEPTALAPLYARLLGHPVTPDGMTDAAYEYNTKLRDQYAADGAYTIIVGAADADPNDAFRAHSFFFGPYYVIPDTDSFTTFMHENGHTFGAVDEYCPDVCNPTTELQGYVGAVNANAVYKLGGDGIDNGMGENQTSLMSDTNADALNGYSRMSWGWYDGDGNGVFDVNDTHPATSLTAVVSGSDVQVQGAIFEQPEARLSQPGNYQPVSLNHEVALEYRLVDSANGAWFSLPLVVDPVTRNTSVDLGTFPVGAHTIQVRTRNSAGNTDVTPESLAFTIAAPAVNSAPRLSVGASPVVGSTRTSFNLTAIASDFDGDSVQLRFDVDGDGKYETGWSSATQRTQKFATPGTYRVTVQVRDAHNALSTATTEIYVVAGNAPPLATIAGTPSELYGQVTATPTFGLAATGDPDGDSVQYNWIVDAATEDFLQHTESGFGTSTHFSPLLATPPTMGGPLIDLTAGDASLANRAIAQVLAVTPTLIASAGGSAGLLFTDVSHPLAPVEVANLQLETSAEQLMLDGTKLYVLGGADLTVVDVSNPKAPVEVKQAKTVTSARSIASSDEVDIGDGARAVAQLLYPAWSERIQSLEIDVDVTHAQPAELTFTLQVYRDGQMQQYLLRDQVAGAGGDRVYKFTDANTPALKALVGSFASGQWGIYVADNTADGVAGTLNSSTLSMQTKSRAFALPATDTQLVGVLPNHGIVAGGLGLQVVDASKPTALKQLSSVTGTGIYAGGLSGTTALVLSPFTAGGKTQVATGGKTPAPQTHALYAVDLSKPAKPVVLRQDESFGDNAGELSLVGTRAYLHLFGSKGGGSPTTSILDVNAFAANQGTYVLGVVPNELFGVIGSSSLVFGLDSGQLEGWDVSVPSAPKLAYTYSRPSAQGLTAVSGSPSGNEAILTVGNFVLLEPDLRQGINILSRVYRVTLQARDSQGAITTSSRNVHVVPYNHAPTLTATIVQGSKAGDTFGVQPAWKDLDLGASWDPHHWVQADLDGDGLYDTGWQSSDSATPSFFRHIGVAGTYYMNLMVRDTFGARATTQVKIVVK